MEIKPGSYPVVIGAGGAADSDGNPSNFMPVAVVVVVHHLRHTLAALVAVVTAEETLQPELQTLAVAVALAILEFRRLVAVPVL